MTRFTQLETASMNQHIIKIRTSVRENVFGKLKIISTKKPAIITSHRFNFIHEIQRENAERNLVGLRNILLTVKERYPDVEFVTTPELVKIMERN